MIFGAKTRQALPKSATTLILAVMLVVAVTMAVTVPATAQDEANPFGEIIDVRVVNLEVVVTRGGERVQGLSPEDFVLKVDGSEVPIEYFTEVQGGAAVASGSEAASATIPALAPGQPVSTSYLVFIDDYFTEAARRNRIIDGLKEQVVTMQPEDRMAVVAYDGLHLEMLTTWSQSPNELIRVLEQARARKTRGPQSDAERRLNAAEIGSGAPPISLPGDSQQQALAADTANAQDNPALSGTALTEAEAVVNATFNGVPMGAVVPNLQAEQQIGILEQQVSKMIAAVNSTLRGFANPPGRKVMLMVSGGWPYSPAEWTGVDVSRGYSQYKNGRRLYGPLIETANRLSYTIYPVDVPFVTDPDRIEDLRATLRLVAQDTGGRPLIGKASFDAFEAVREDTRTYYWLGFTPQWKGDNEGHEITVEARQRGMKVRSRKSFADFSRQQEVSMMVESALLLGDTPPAAAEMPARLGPQKAAGRNKVEVPIDLLVPMSALAFIPQGDAYAAQAELRVSIQDKSGEIMNSEIVPLNIQLDEAPKDGDMRRWSTKLTLRKAPHDILVSLFDPVAGSFLSARLEMKPST